MSSFYLGFHTSSPNTVCLSLRKKKEENLEWIALVCLSNVALTIECHRLPLTRISGRFDSIEFLRKTMHSLAHFFPWKFGVMGWSKPVSFLMLLLQSFSWIPWNLSFRYIHCTGQFTPKMKVNAEPRCFHLWCELTLALWCHSIIWSLFSWNEM